MALRGRGYSVVTSGPKAGWKRAHLKVRQGASQAPVQRVKFFPPETSDDDIDAWRSTERAELRKRKVIKGTLGADIETYLKMRSSMPFSDRKRELSMWVPAFGERPKDSIPPGDSVPNQRVWRALLH